MNKLSAILLVVVLSQCQAQRELEGSLSSCLNSASLDACLIKLAERLRTYMSVGLPDYGVPVTEPMTLDFIELQLVNKLINVSLEFSNTTVRGLSSFVLKNVTASKEKNTINTQLMVPLLSTNGDYKINGRIGPLLLDETESQFRVSMEEVEVEMFVQLAQRNGKLFIQEDPVIKPPKIGDLKVELDGLFEGKPKLKEFAETFINDSDKFIEDFGPQISKQIGKLAAGVYNAAIQDLPPSLFGLQS